MAKSFTIKLGADTKDFIKAMKDTDKQINATQRSAQALDKALGFEFDADKAVLAQKQFKSALDLTEKKAEELRKQLAVLERSGRVDTADYQTLQTMLVQTETKALQLKKRLEEVSKIEIEQISKKFKDVGDSIEKAGQKLAPFSVAAAGAIAGAAAIGKAAAKTGADIDDMTQRFDLSAETVQRWQYLALQGGVDVDVFTKALVRMRAVTADIAAGTSNKATDFLGQMGIDPTKFASQEEMFDGIIDALASVKNYTLQTAYANEIFGDKIATQMLPYIRAGAEDLAKWNAEFDAMPYLSGEAAGKLALLDDSFNRLETTVKLATAQLGLAFAPIIERVVVWIEEKLVPAIESLAEWFNSLDEDTQNIILVMLGLIAALAPLLILIGKISTGIGSLIPIFMKLRTAVTLTRAAVGSLGAALAIGLDLLVNWSKMSTIERILKGVAAAAFLAAAAFAAFHASWSVGAAVAAIAVGVTAAIAAIVAAKKTAEAETGAALEEVSTNNSGGYSAGLSEKDLADIDSYTKSANNTGGSSNSYSNVEDNSNYIVNVYVTEPAASAEDIAKAVSREIATLAQSRG